MGESRKQRDRRRHRERLVAQLVVRGAAPRSRRRVARRRRLPQFVLTKRLLSIAEIADVPPKQSIAAALATVPVERALDWIARMLGIWFHTGTRDTRERELAVQWFAHDPATHQAVIDELDDGAVLIVPAVLKLFAMLALVHCSDAPAGDNESDQDVENYYNRILPVAMLTAAHFFGDAIQGTGAQRTAPVAAEGDISPLELELAANVLANHAPYPPSMFDRSERRWIELPAEDSDAAAVNLAVEFEAATGASLVDLRTVGLALHARAISREGPPRVASDYLPKLALGAHRLNAVMDVISLPLAEMRSRARNDPPKNVYDTALLGQFPVVGINNGQLLVLDPILLFERVFGWLPRWDLQHGPLRTAADNAVAANAVNYLATVTQEHAMEALTAAAAAPLTAGVVYGEKAVQQAWGTDAPNADAVVRWPSTAVVVEISSRPPNQDTVRAQPHTGLAKDLDFGVLRKARQLHGTVNAMRADPGALNGDPTTPSRFYPVLVTTEGFPVTPLTSKRIHTMLAVEGLLQGSDVAPLIIVDVEALEAVETIGERGGPNLMDLLAAHETSPILHYGFRQWLLTQYQGTGAPLRVRVRWARVTDKVLATLAA